MRYYILMWKNGLRFSGRSTRSEFWFPTLFNTIIMFLCYGIFFAFNYQYFTAVPVDMEPILANYLVLQIVVGLYGLATFVPLLALTVRRLHDIGRSGLWILYFFIACIALGVVGLFLPEEGLGIIVTALLMLAMVILWLVFLVTKSQPETNKYGDNPKSASAISPASADYE